MKDISTLNFFRSSIRKYVSFVRKATRAQRRDGTKDLNYWREVLFTKFITYLFPTCLLALIPGLFMAFKEGLYIVAAADLIAVLSIATISLNMKLSLTFRKAYVMGILYLLSIALLIELSLVGPGTVYLLALSILTTIFFSKNWGYFSVVANFFICVGCALIIHFKLFNSPLVIDYEIEAWVSVSTNVIFMSFLLVVLIGNTIQGLEQMINKQVLLKNNLEKEVKKGIKTNRMLTESESHFKSLFIQSPSPMWVLEADSLRFLLVNEAACQNYGYTTEEFLSMSIMDIKIGGDIENVYQDIQKKQQTKTPIAIITKHTRKNKEVFFAEVVFDSILFNGKVATLAISNDITQKVNYIQAIEKQNGRFKEIAWIQSHKFRAPLANILGLAYLFENEAVDTKEIIEGIKTSSVQLDTVIKEITDKTSAVEL